ncbi:MAG: ADP-ribosylation factor-like protein [Promethearchaeota archaeon]
MKKNVGKNIKKISDILDLSIEQFKDANYEDIKILNDNKIKTIRDLSKLNPEQVQKIAKTTQINETNLENYYIASKLISRAWQKRSEYKQKESNKICVVGLDNAGKSTIIKLLEGSPLSNAVNQEPTVDVNQIKISKENYELIMWDFAGQIQFREQYIENPETYFLNIDLVLLVVDAQDAERYDEALIYFEKIMNTIKFLGENPFFLIMLHKSDPELLDDPDFQINSNFIKEKLGELMKKFDFQYEIINSSIYSAFSSQPTVVDYLKKLFKQEKDNPNLILIDILTKLINNLFEIADRILYGQQQIMAMIDELKPPQLYKEKKTIAMENIAELENVKPSELISSQLQLEDETPVVEGPSRKSVLNELKSMFQNIGISRKQENQ